MVTLYHGSGRVFGKFLLNKLGEGDGRSVGGYGIYFSKIKEVAMQHVTKGGALYQCDVYEDGWWLDLDKDIDPETASDIAKQMVRRKLAGEEDVFEFRYEYTNPDKPVTGEQVYKYLSIILGSEKNTSSLLRAMGCDGNTFLDRGTMINVAATTPHPELLEDGKGRNYVLFDEDNLVIKHMYKYDELQGGTAYVD
jgi:hypothetical protein